MMTIERLEREANERKQRMNQVEAAAKEYSEFFIRSTFYFRDALSHHEY